jgi:hypothetical protein
MYRETLGSNMSTEVAMLIEAVAVPFERVARIGSAPVTPRI